MQVHGVIRVEQGREEIELQKLIRGIIVQRVRVAAADGVALVIQQIENAHVIRVFPAVEFYFERNPLFIGIGPDQVGS